MAASAPETLDSVDVAACAMKHRVTMAASAPETLDIGSMPRSAPRPRIAASAPKTLDTFRVEPLAAHAR